MSKHHLLQWPCLRLNHNNFNWQIYLRIWYTLLSIRYNFRLDVQPQPIKCEPISLLPRLRMLPNRKSPCYLADCHFRCHSNTLRYWMRRRLCHLLPPQTTSPTHSTALSRSCLFSTRRLHAAHGQWSRCRLSTMKLATYATNS